jgi:hypothetical protein
MQTNVSSYVLLSKTPENTCMLTVTIMFLDFMLDSIASALQEIELQWKDEPNVIIGIKLLEQVSPCDHHPKGHR